MEEFSKDLTKTEIVDIGLAILLKLLNVKKGKSLMKGGQQSILKKYLHLKRILFNQNLLDQPLMQLNYTSFVVTTRSKFGREIIILIHYHGGGKN